MRLPFARFPSAEPNAERLHDALIAHIRTPVFYTQFGVPDTFEGRFDLLLLHAALVLRRLRELGPDGQALGQALVDLMFKRLDVALRELGVSDIGVPKRMKRLAEAFKGRSAAYDAALNDSDAAALSAALSRNILNDAAPGAALARYAEAAMARLGQAGRDLASGVQVFPDPTPFAEP